MQDVEVSDGDIQSLWKTFDRLKDGVIHFEEFVGTYRGIEQLVQLFQKQQQSTVFPLR
jgi:IS1 family transposase